MPRSQSSPASAATRRRPDGSAAIVSAGEDGRRAGTVSERPGPAIGFAEAFALLYARRWLLIGVFFGAAVVAAGLSLLLPNVYRGEATIAPVVTDQEAGLSLPGVDSLASLVGLSMPGSGNVDENLAVLRSRDFIWRFIREKQLMPVLYADLWDSENGRWLDDDPANQPSAWDAYRLFTRKLFGVSRDAKTGLVKVSIDWYDPELAAQWVNDIIRYLNEHLRVIAIDRSEKNLEYLYQELEDIEVADMRQTLYQLIEKEQRTAMIVNTQKEYAFRVLDPAVAPDRKVRPKRAILVALVAILAFLLAAGVVLYRSVHREPGTRGK